MRKFLISESYNLYLYRLFIFFETAIYLSSRIEIKPLIQGLNQKRVALDQVRSMNTETISKYSYSSNACIMQSVRSEPFGIINNITKSCRTILGVDRSQLIGVNIHDFMPEFYRKSHI